MLRQVSVIHFNFSLLKNKDKYVFLPSFYVSLLPKYKKLRKKKTHKNKDQNIRFCKNQQQTWFKKNYGASQTLNQNHSHLTPQIPQPPFDPLLPTSNQV